jgi:hypothetical protein
MLPGISALHASGTTPTIDITPFETEPRPRHSDHTDQGDAS